MNNIIETNRKIIHEESINVGQRIKAERIIEEWLKKIEGDVYGWLNYVDQTTIGYLNNLPRTCKIQIITSEIQNKNKFQTEASKLGKVIPKLEIKVIRVNPEISSDKSQDFSEKERAIIHKRKLITNETIIDFGTDLKSSALGNTKHSMLLMAADLSNLEEFAEEWNRDGDEWKRIEGIPIKVTYYKWPNE